MRSCPTVSGGPGQQCCYDDTGKLITCGTAAGTPDKVSPINANCAINGFWSLLGWPGQDPLNAFVSAANAISNFQSDVATFNSCRSEGRAMTDYLRARPPNNGLKCPNNPVGDDEKDKITKKCCAPKKVVSPCS